MMLRDIMRDMLSAFGWAGPTLRLPDESHMRHLVKNHVQAMVAAEERAERTAAMQENNPKKGELRLQRDRSIARIEEIARSLRDAK